MKLIGLNKCSCAYLTRTATLILATRGAEEVDDIALLELADLNIDILATRGAEEVDDIALLELADLNIDIIF